MLPDEAAGRIVQRIANATSQHARRESAFYMRLLPEIYGCVKIINKQQFEYRLELVALVLDELGNLEDYIASLNLKNEAKGGRWKRMYLALKGNVILFKERLEKCNASSCDGL